eukprot:CAMPEP_0184480338 /NCGR_PEP_ID=MMETSP0113_2-20130426/1821_1 /TAXON_ID=91329 /ORGANISM="Norrisiella sphaerica, Strain BC52" /LENGTH=199 /DNA_ID=CAMNT_0026858737 /DNA_START=376 /DNA_END=975 /DNA_ORIENTATION=+
MKEVEDMDMWNFNFTGMRMGNDERDDFYFIDQAMEPKRKQIREQFKEMLFEERYQREKKVMSGELNVSEEEITSEFEYNETRHGYLRGMPIYDVPPEGLFGGISEKEFNETYGEDERYIDNFSRRQYLPWMTEERAKSLVSDLERSLKDLRDHRIRQGHDRLITPTLHPGVRDPGEWLQNPSMESETDSCAGNADHCEE